MENSEFQLLSQQITALQTMTHAQFINVNDRLDKINGKVAHHEEQITEALIERAQNREQQRNQANVHVINCPVKPRVEALEKESISTKAVKSWILASVGVTGIVVTIIFALFKIFTGSV